MTDIASPNTFQNSSGSCGYKSRLNRKLSSASSYDGQVDEQELNETYRSEDLDKLSICLSEASSVDIETRQRPSLYEDIVNAQMGLWTIIVTVFYSYGWKQHRKKFVLSVFVFLPLAVLICCTLSALFTTTVILGRIFCTPVPARFDDFINGNDDQDEGGAGGLRRDRTNSGNSSNSGRSFEELPRPMCRKHSNEGSSLSLSGNGNGSLGDCGFAGGRSDTISSGGSTFRHQYSHHSGGAQESD